MKNKVVRILAAILCAAATVYLTHILGVMNEISVPTILVLSLVCLLGGVGTLAYYTSIAIGEAISLLIYSASVHYFAYMWLPLVPTAFGLIHLFFRLLNKWMTK